MKLASAIFHLVYYSLYFATMRALSPKKTASSLILTGRTGYGTYKLKAAEIALLIKILTHFPWAKPCLVRVLTVSATLSRFSNTTQIEIGAMGSIEKLDVHAWILIDNHAYFENDGPYSLFQQSCIQKKV